MKRFLKWVAIVAGTLFLLIALLAGSLSAWMKLSGERDGKKALGELQAKGEKLDLAQLLPPRPPDAENFYGDPLWLQLADQIPVTKEYKGISYVTLEPRLPKDHQLINSWKLPLTEQEKQMFLNLVALDEEPMPDRYHAILKLRQLLRECVDPHRQELIADAIVELLKPSSSLLDSIRNLSTRPSAVFPVTYIGLQTAFPNIFGVLEFTTLLSAQACADFVFGKTGGAAEDIQTLLRISLLMRYHPSWIQFLVRITVAGQGIKGVNAGIVRHLWSDNDLQQFQKVLSAIDLPRDLPWVFRTERDLFLESDLSKTLPIALPDVSKFFLSPLYLQFELGHSLRRNQKFIETLESCDMKSGLNESKVHFLHLTGFEKLLYPYSESSPGNAFILISKAVETQTTVNQTLIACALERYWLTHASYPTTLDVLVPKYLTAIPKEPTTGQPMHYRLLTDGTFLIWAPGWKLHTLDGKPSTTSGDGDIVWNQPFTPLATPNSR